MTILDNLRAASTDALKAGDKNMRTLTGVLIGDMEMVDYKLALKVVVHKMYMLEQM